MKGSDWIKAVEEEPGSPLEDMDAEAMIESVGSSEAREAIQWHKNHFDAFWVILGHFGPFFMLAL